MSEFTEATKRAEDVQAVAKAFARILREYLTSEEVAEVIERNKAREPGICHSHDFCDANEPMYEAMRERFPDWEPDGETEAGFDIWGAAWDAAIASEFAV